MAKIKNAKKKYEILDIDPYLSPYEADINLRMDEYFRVRETLLKDTSISDFACAHHFLGFHKTADGWFYREWADKATEMFLIGDFNGWQTTHPLTKRADGLWEIFIPGADSLVHGQKIKVKITTCMGVHDRIPLFAKQVVQELDHSFTAVVWDDSLSLPITPLKNPPKEQLIYECHIGMAQDAEKIGSFDEFAEIVLPRICDLGYTAIQIMGVSQHPYYASFGYHVANFFAVSNWFGDPNGLRRLISACHERGIAVYIDVVHSHAVKNVIDGINLFDGTESQFFCGDHPHWDSKLFNYADHRVLWFLLSNIRYWIEEFDFDGFRFDGVTSMLYSHHGIGSAFMSYSDYFNPSTNLPAITYLQLANELIREIKPQSMTIAEDMSGMPGMCLPIAKGGIGFDYRLNMGVPDMWIKLTKDIKDEDWSISHIYHELTSKRPQEKVISYTESHDQALVGDKTLIFRLADKEMYEHMSKGDNNMIIDRAFALFKNMNLATMALADGFLNFMGNEFGHPEWIDFPREGNGGSYQYARRQWHLADDQNLKFSELLAFSKAAVEICKRAGSFNTPPEVKYFHEEKKIFAFEKNGYIFAFNFNPTYSETEFYVGAGKGDVFECVFTSDAGEFGGFERVSKGEEFYTFEKYLGTDQFGFQTYLPARCACVYKRK